jgi:glutathione S-transferase
VLSEAAAIVLHLVDQHPDAGLAPKIGTPERAKFYQWLTFLTNSLQEELMIWQYPERLADNDAAAAAVVKRGAEARASTFLHRRSSQGRRSPVPRQSAQRRRLLPRDALALGAPYDQTATLAS